MKKLSLLPLLVCVLALRGDAQEVPRPQQATVFPFRDWTLSREFKADQPARFVVVGSGATYLGGYVFDPNGNCVVWDDQGNSATRDDLALIWQPSETAHHTIEVRSFGRRRNRFEYSLRP